MSSNNEVEVIDNSNNNITTLSPQLQRFIHLYITGQYTMVKLSDLLDVHVNTLYNWLKRKDVKHIIHDMQESTHSIVGDQIKALSLKAIDKLSSLIDSPIDGVALQAVNSTLDRGGHKPKQEIKVDKTVTTYEQRLNQLIDNVIDLGEDAYEVNE